MYKVLLVDDERIIVEGISRIVQWNSLGTELIGTARNGIDALQFIEGSRPDIVISDIKMPGMDGLQLVQRLYELDPTISIILLSGFSEFDYAQKAMHYGVKHYLLKPCNEKVIMEALQTVVEELETAQKHQNFIKGIQTELQKVLPYAKEQFLKELVTNKMFGKKDWEEYGRLFHIEQSNEVIRLLLIHLEGSYEFEHLFAVRNIAQDVFGADTLLMDTTIGTDVLLLVSGEHEEPFILEKLQEIKQIFSAYYRMEPTIAVSEKGAIVDARKLYRETQECLSYRFYLGDGSIIMKSDIERHDTAGARTLDYEDEQICLSIKLGDWSRAESELQQFFQWLADSRMQIGLLTSYVIPLYISIVRQGQPDLIANYMQELVRFGQLTTLRSIEQFVMETAEQICMRNYTFHTSKHSGIINRIITVIQEQLGNPELSLNWVASEILYMNADYLGKLFKKETGEKFSNYVVRLRMERAVAEIETTGDVKVFELAEKLGFGDNPQYFSQVFKKHTGVTPSEYKRSP